MTKHFNEASPSGTVVFCAKWLSGNISVSPAFATKTSAILRQYWLALCVWGEIMVIVSPTKPMLLRCLYKDLSLLQWLPPQSTFLTAQTCWSILCRLSWDDYWMKSMNFPDQSPRLNWEIYGGFCAPWLWGACWGFLWFNQWLSWRTSLFPLAFLLTVKHHMHRKWLFISLFCTCLQMGFSTGNLRLSTEHLDIHTCRVKHKYEHFWVRKRRTNQHSQGMTKQKIHEAWLLKNSIRLHR